MKTKLIAVCYCIFACSACYHFNNKTETINFTKKRQEKTHVNLVIEDEGKILRILVRDTNFQHLDEVYQFSDEGEQLKYSNIAACDSCFQKYLANTLKSKSYQWKQLNDSTYLSKYSLKRVLNIHNSNFSYDIVKHNRSKQEYNILLKRAKN